MTQVQTDPLRSAVAVELIREIDAIEERLIANRLQAFLEIARERQVSVVAPAQWLDDPAVARRLDNRALELTVTQTLLPSPVGPPAVGRKRVDAEMPERSRAELGRPVSTDPAFRQPDIDTATLRLVEARNIEWAQRVRATFVEEAARITAEREATRRERDAREQSEQRAQTTRTTTSRPAPVVGAAVAAQLGTLVGVDPAVQAERDRQVAREVQEQARAQVEKQQELAREREVAEQVLVREQTRLREQRETERAQEFERAQETERVQETEQELQLEASRESADPRTSAVEQADREREQQLQAEIAEVERWNDIAAWEASRRVERARSEIDQILRSDNPDLRQVYRWMDYAMRDGDMTNGLRQPVASAQNPGLVNGRTTQYYRPLIQDVQLRDAHFEKQRAMNQDPETRSSMATTAAAPAALLSVMKGAQEAGRQASQTLGPDVPGPRFEPLFAPQSDA